jgi:hypothetical protein
MTIHNMKKLSTRTDFVGMYKTSHTYLARHIRNGDISVHLIGTTIYIDIEEALSVLGNPPLRSQVREETIKSDLFA